MKAFKPNAWTNIFCSIQLKYEFLIQTQNGIFNKAAHHLHCSLCESWHSLHGFVQIIRHESLCFACYYMYPSHRQNKIKNLQSYLKIVRLYLCHWGRRKLPPSSIWFIRFPNGDLGTSGAHLMSLHILFSLDSSSASKDHYEDIVQRH